MSYNFWQLRVWGLKSLMRVNSRAASHNRFRLSPYYFATKENPSLQFFSSTSTASWGMREDLCSCQGQTPVSNPLSLFPHLSRAPLKSRCAPHISAHSLQPANTSTSTRHSWLQLGGTLYSLWDGSSKQYSAPGPQESAPGVMQAVFPPNSRAAQVRGERLSGDRGAESGGSEGGEHGAPRRWGAEGGESEDPPWDAWTQHHGEPHGVLLPGWIQPHPWDPGESAAVKWDHRYALLCVFAFQRVSSSAQFTPSIHVQWKRPRRNHVDSSIWFHLTKKPHISILSKLCNFLFYGLAEIRDRNCQWQLLHKR